MITLGIDTSAAFVSAALGEDGQLLGERFVRGEQTHSETLLPMIDTLLSACGLGIHDVKRFAVTHGPGSFTGVRIGVSLVKGLAFADGKLCAGISTLAAMASPATAEHLPGILCCAMDARRAQVYAALFDGTGTRLTPDAALSIAALEAQLEVLQRPVWFLGDGAELCYAAMRQREDWQLAPTHCRYQRGWGAILATADADYLPAEQLRATYLRPSQAERLRLGLE
jgi:tRNA threonylcarbamoyladenosine biosynthesis protein TsaB